MHADSVQLDLPASHTYLHLLGSCIQGIIDRVEGVEDAEAVAYNVQLAAHEIGTNIVEHAYGGNGTGRIAIALTLDRAETLLTIELHDTGRAFDPAGVCEPVLGEPQIHGYGLFLARELMDTVEYEARPDGNYWRLTRRLVQPS